MSAPSASPPSALLGRPPEERSLPSRSGDTRARLPRFTADLEHADHAWLDTFCRELIGPDGRRVPMVVVVRILIKRLHEDPELARQVRDQARRGVGNRYAVTQ